MTQERESTPEEQAVMAERLELVKMSRRQRVEIDAAREAVSQAENKLNHRLKMASVLDNRLARIEALLGQMGALAMAPGGEAL